MPWRSRPTGAVSDEPLLLNPIPSTAPVATKENPMTLTRLILAATLVASGTWAHALDIQPYSAQALAAAQKADQPIAVHFHADWCPTCRAQDKVLQSLKTEKDLELTVLTANYDTEKDLKRRLRVNAQSTLLVFKGPKEAARLVGDTAPDAIRAALKAAL